VLLLCSNCKGTCFWHRLQTGSMECVLRGHDHPITCSLLLIPQTSIVLTGSSDKTIRVGKTDGAFSY